MNIEIVLESPSILPELNKEELVSVFIQATERLSEISALEKEIREMLKEKISLDGEIISDMAITHTQRFSFKTTIEEAQQFGAVTQEVDAEKIPYDYAARIGAVKSVINTDLLKKLYKKGATIPGIEISRGIRIASAIKTKKAE